MTTLAEAPAAQPAESAYGRMTPVLEWPMAVLALGVIPRSIS